MEYSGINYLAVVVAAVAGFAWGAIWYMSLSKPWMAAARIDPAKAAQSGRSIEPFIVSAIMLLVMAFALAAVLNSIGFYGWLPGVHLGVIAWIGFMLPTVAVNQRYQGYGWNLTIIDALHWLGVALIMGAIIGAWGPSEPAV